LHHSRVLVSVKAAVGRSPCTPNANPKISILSNIQFRIKHVSFRRFGNILPWEKELQISESPYTTKPLAKNTADPAPNEPGLSASTI
jgi:hypothetical protein